MGKDDAMAKGWLAAKGLLSDDEVKQAGELIERAERDEIETIRIVFADQHGILRGKTITREALGSALTSGIRVPSTLLLKDLSHRTVFPVWGAGEDGELVGASDALLVPLPSTISSVPWSPHSLMLHSEVRRPTGEALTFTSRAILEKAIGDLTAAGYEALFGLEVEFQVFEVVDRALEHSDATMPASAIRTRGLNQGYQLLTETRYGAAEELLDELRRTAQAMGMPVRSVEVEFGPNQFEFTFAPGDPMQIADMAVTFRTMVKEVCQRRELHASFMSKPNHPNAAANGWHIHQSVKDTGTGENLFGTSRPGDLSSFGKYWVAGLLEHARASCLLTTPTVNGYKRFAPFQLAPNRIGWGIDNRGAMIRAIVSAETGASRVENRVAESALNPYYALASQIVSGLDGVSQKRTVPDPLSSPYADGAEALPDSLEKAIDAFAASDFYRHSLGGTFVDFLVHLKRSEWQRYQLAVSEWEQKEYFNIF